MTQLRELCRLQLLDKQEQPEIVSLYRWYGPRGDWYTVSTWAQFNIKTASYQYRKSHCGDKTIVRSSYFHNGISYTGKMPSLYWTRALVVICQPLGGVHRECETVYAKRTQSYFLCKPLRESSIPQGLTGKLWYLYYWDCFLCLIKGLANKKTYYKHNLSSPLVKTK